MIPPGKRRILGPHVTLQALEEIHILPAHKRDQHPHRPLNPAPEQNILPAHNKIRLGDRRRKILSVKVRHESGPIGCAVEVALCVDELDFRAGLVRLLGGALGSPQNPDVAEFVSAGDGFVVDHGCAGRPSVDGVIRPRKELVAFGFVDGVGNPLLDITDDDTVTLRLQRHDKLRGNLGLGLAEKLLETKIIDSQCLANAGKETALEGDERHGGFFNLGLVDEFQVTAIVVEAVDMDVAFAELARAENHVLAGTHDKEALAVLAGKRHNGSTDGGFVVVEVDTVENAWLIADRVDNADTRCPPVPGLGIAKLLWRQNGCVTISIRLSQQLRPEFRWESIVVGFDGVEVGLLGVFDQALWCIGQRNGLLDHVVPELLDGEDSNSPVSKKTTNKVSKQGIKQLLQKEQLIRLLS